MPEPEAVLASRGTANHHRIVPDIDYRGLPHFIVLLCFTHPIKSRAASQFAEIASSASRNDRVCMCVLLLWPQHEVSNSFTHHPSCTTGLDPVAAEAIPRQPDIKHRSFSSFNILRLEIFCVCMKSRTFNCYPLAHSAQDIPCEVP